MQYFKSSRNADTTKPIVLSFDINKSSLSLVFGLAVSNTNSNFNTSMALQVDIHKNSGSFVEIIENTINKSSTHENNTFLGKKVIIEHEESKSGVLNSKNEIISPRPKLEKYDSETHYVSFENTLNELSNGSVMFMLTDEPKTNNVIYSELGTYELADENAFTITPFVLAADNENPLLLDVDNDSLTFLLLGNEVKQDFSKQPTNIFTKTFSSQSYKEYDSKLNDYTSKLNDDTQNNDNQSYRCRFVMSNNCRNISFSVYENSTKSWKVIKNSIYNIEPISDENKMQKIIFGVTDPSYVSNITANF